MSEYVMVAVPEHRVPEVYALLAPSPVIEQPRPNTNGSDEWTEDEIRRAYRESSSNMKQMLDYLADRPGQDIQSVELYEEMALDSSQFRGVVGSFGNRSSNRYGKANWFFDARWDNELGRAVYTMSEDVAAVIRQEAA